MYWTIGHRLEVHPVHQGVAAIGHELGQPSCFSMLSPLRRFGKGGVIERHPVDDEARQRIFETAATFFRLEGNSFSPAHRPQPVRDIGSSAPAYPSFSEGTPMSPKEFLFQKQPRSDVERIAALAYYLTHYRDTPHFKTLDLSKLNTEAAQPKFSNAANSASNAVKRGYLVPSTKGQRQLSAAGERFVSALPDREAARAAMVSAQPRRKAGATREAQMLRAKANPHPA